MSKPLPEITSELSEWISRQRLFFVATAPLEASGHVNCSPKGGDSFRVLDPRTVAYLDHTGSGAETAAHLRENGRIVIVFCAFEGPPRILRLHGRGHLLLPGKPEYAALVPRFSPSAGARAIVRVDVGRVSTSCGMAVPLLDFRAPREDLERWAAGKGPEALREYRRRRNARSIDGLAALEGLEGDV